MKVKVDRIVRSALKKNANVTAWAGFLIISVLIWKLVSDGDFSFIMVSCHFLALPIAVKEGDGGLILQYV